MSSSGGKVRAVAAEIIDAVAEGGRSLDAAIAEREVDIAAKDRSLLRMICYGSLRQHWQLQFWVQQLIRKPLRKRDRVVNSLLACATGRITGKPYSRQTTSARQCGCE